MGRRRPPRFNALLPIAKASGPTSHDVVDMARRALSERRIGHTGTLDPMAEGLLLLCVGRCTRLQQHLLGWDKTYRGVIRLGQCTDTYDAEGEPVGEPRTVPNLDDDCLRDLERRFSGSYDQIPPPYSAKKVAGRKLYELARRGETPEVAPRTVTVHHLGIERTGNDTLEIEVRADTGFYVRSLAHELGETLGCGGHLKRLVRTRIGPFELSAALTQESMESAASPEDILEHPAWVPLDEVPLPYPEAELNPVAAERFLHGQEVVVTRTGDTGIEAGNLMAVRHRGALLGIGTVQHVMARGRTVGIQPSVVIAAPQ